MDILQILGKATMATIVKLVQALTLFRKDKDDIKREPNVENNISVTLRNWKFNGNSYHCEGSQMSGWWVWGPWGETEIFLACEKKESQECHNKEWNKPRHHWNNPSSRSARTRAGRWGKTLLRMWQCSRFYWTTWLVCHEVKVIAWLVSRSSFMKPNVVDDKEFLMEAHQAMKVLVQYNSAKCIGGTYYFMDFQMDYNGTKLHMLSVQHSLCK